MSPSGHGAPEPGAEPAGVDPVRLATSRGATREERGAEDAPHLEPFLVAKAPKKARKRAIWWWIALGVIGAAFVASVVWIPYAWRADERDHPSSGDGAAESGSQAAPVGLAPSGAASEVASSAASGNPSPSGSARAGERVPKTTSQSLVGRIPVVDLGRQETRTLEESLRAERASAAAEHRTLVVMIVRYDFAEHLVHEAMLSDPRMQEALGDVRIVRIDGRYYDKELTALGFKAKVVPTLCLLGPDLRPRDVIDGREWDEDSVENIAPIVSAFVRGTYKKRRHPWTPLPSRGEQL